MAEQNINFDSLVSQIEQTNEALQNNARLVINRHVTAKAWLTGYYIVEYEQNGSDRAKYGDRLLQNLSKRLGGKNFSYRSLKLYRQFFVTYVGLFEPIKEYVIRSFPIRQSLIAQFETFDCQTIEISQSLTNQLAKDKNLPIGQSVIAQLMESVTLGVAPEVGQEMAEYTLLDTDEDVFISKYELNIPSKERMTEFLRKENEGLNKENKR